MLEKEEDKMRHMLKSLLFAMALVFSVAQAVAHETGPGPNGGAKVDAGKYHVEFVADGSTTIFVYLTDEDDKPVAATGFKANAIFVVGGQPVRFPLVPAGSKKLTGTAPVAVAPGVKGAIQLTAPDGTTAQAKF